MYAHTDSLSDTPQKLWALLAGWEVLTIPHHPGYPLDRSITGTDWRYHHEKYQPVVEIYSKHGASEYYGNPKGLAKSAKGNFLQDALKRGYHIGFIAGSDTHIGKPGSEIKEPNECLPHKEAGLTAVYSDELTRPDILGAIAERRCYGTTHSRMIIEFELNGYMMGSEVVLRHGEKVHIRAFIAGTAIISKLYLIRDNQEIYVKEDGSEDIEFEYTDKGLNKGEHYYYLRVVQKDGKLGWASPIWVKVT